MLPQRSLRALAEVRLGRQRSPQNAEGPHMVPYLRAANVKDGSLHLDDVKSMNFTPEEQAIFQLRPGDVLVTEGSGSLSSVGASAVWDGSIEGPICFQNTLIRLRPRPGVSKQFLGWWARAAFGSGQFAAIASGANIFHLGAETVRAMSAPLPDPEQQRRIADFLDAETARIDALITAKQHQAETIQLRTFIAAQTLILGGGNPMDRSPRTSDGITRPKLIRLCSLQRGHDLPADRRMPGSVPIVSSGGPSGSHDVAAATPPGVVTGRYGTIGEVYWSEVPFWPLNTTLYVVDFHGNDPRWIYWLLRCLPLDAESEKSAVGGINRNVIGELRVERPSLDRQGAIATELDMAEASSLAACATLTRQIALLRERRQALITAAVTGELAV